MEPHLEPPTWRDWLLERFPLLLVAILVVTLAGLGVGVATLVTADDGTPTALCLTLTSPPASSAACVNGSGSTISSSTTTTPEPTTTNELPPTTTTPGAELDPGPKAPYPTVPGTCVGGNDGKAGNAKTGVISCWNRPVYLEQQNVAYDLVQVRVDNDAPDNAKKAVYLRQGSGHIEWLRVSQHMCDAAIGGLHDFVIEHVRIKNWDTSRLDCHNDGVQINSSVNVLIRDMDLWGTGHSAAFIGAGSDGFPGRSVVFDGGCWGNMPAIPGYPARNLDVGISIAESDSSGVRNVTIEPVKQHEIYVPSTPSSGGPPATNPIVQPNTLPPAATVDSCGDPIPEGY